MNDLRAKDHFNQILFSTLAVKVGITRCALVAVTVLLRVHSDE